jgi:aminoglycoside phosphotransferase family enzyme/predicted kinase
MEKRLLRSLLKPAAYDEQTTAVRLVQTHVSYLFVTDRFVYKIKKPVDLGFLNFSTLDRRRFYCNEEVRLNSRLCPEIYLGVVEVHESASGANLHGEGPIVDYAVKMKRLPAERMLDRLLAENGVCADEVRRIARTIAAFHLTAERGVQIDQYGGVETIRHNWEENFRQLEEFVGVSLERRDLRYIHDWVDRFIGENGELFASRVERGFIRDCDGDIHAENICLTDSVCIYDCIEFNARFRYSDTAADIAFLLMDFDFHRRREFAAICLEEYRRATGDDAPTPLVEFYKVYRAVVRGKVESFRLRDPHIPDEDKEEARERGARYFMLARGYCLREKLPPSLIIICGLMGSGKSSVAAEISFQLGIDVVSSDRVRKELARVASGRHCFDPYDEGLYAPAVSAATYREMLSRAEASLRAGRSVLVDATFRRKSDRLLFRALAESLSVPFVIIETACVEELARERLEERLRRNRDVSDGRWEIYSRQKEEFEPVGDTEGRRIFVDTSRPIGASVDDIFKGMGLS